MVRTAADVRIAENDIKQAEGLKREAEGDLRQLRSGPQSPDNFYAACDRRVCPLERSDCRYHPKNATTVPDEDRDARIAERQADYVRHSERVNELTAKLAPVPEGGHERTRRLHGRPGRPGRRGSSHRHRTRPLGRVGGAVPRVHRRRSVGRARAEEGREGGTQHPGVVGPAEGRPGGTGPASEGAEPAVRRDAEAVDRPGCRRGGPPHRADCTRSRTSRRPRAVRRWVHWRKSSPSTWRTWQPT